MPRLVQSSSQLSPPQPARGDPAATRDSTHHREGSDTRSCKPSHQRCLRGDRSREIAPPESGVRTGSQAYPGLSVQAQVFLHFVWARICHNGKTLHTATSLRAIVPAEALRMSENLDKLDKMVRSCRIQTLAVARPRASGPTGGSWRGWEPQRFLADRTGWSSSLGLATGKGRGSRAARRLGCSTAGNLCPGRVNPCWGSRPGVSGRKRA